MADKTQAVTLRVPEEMVNRIDSCVQELEAQHPGLSVNRTQAMLMLLERGLDHFEGKARPRAKTRETKA